MTREEIHRLIHLVIQAVTFLGWWVHVTLSRGEVKWPPTIGDEKGTAWITWHACFSKPVIRSVLLVFLHMMSWGILWSPSLGSKSHGFFFLRKCKNGKRISIGSLDSQFFWHEKWGGGAAKSPFDFHPFMLIKHALIFLFSFSEGAFGAKKPSKKLTTCFS